MKSITFNWGPGIFLFYTVFACVLIFVVYKSTQVDHSLVVDNYYDHDLAYQSHYDRLENTAKLDEPLQLQWASTTKEFTLSFPAEIEEAISGEVAFYRPNNKSLDWGVPIAVDEAKQMDLDLSKLPVGRWKVQVKWEAGGVPYFAERIIDVR